MHPLAGHVLSDDWDQYCCETESSSANQPTEKSMEKDDSNSKEVTKSSQVLLLKRIPISHVGQ